MAHISGLVAAQEAANPFEYCDVVTTTTHKSLRGPRAGMIFYRKGPKPPKKGQPEGAVYDYEDKINFAVFPSLQGGPYNHQIAALAVALQQTMSPGFKAYAKQVKANAVAIGNYLMSKGYKMVTDGTENHLVLWDLRPLGLTGNKVEKLCDLCHTTLNKNDVFGDSSAVHCLRVVSTLVMCLDIFLVSGPGMAIVGKPKFRLELSFGHIVHLDDQ
ncbi:Serine hydroxymethyltransferase 4 [Zea mays]|uniref:Serine hydroxymethyltransferase 4 n=1 Tax=Zea mays TaxID=4577 RepID=A0A3L6DY18_MAIZE|nr:Serine hydroxymethyltransferase 4 [Zea mays]